MDKIVERLVPLGESFLVSLISSTAKLVTNSLKEVITALIRAAEYPRDSNTTEVQSSGLIMMTTLLTSRLSRK